MILKKVLFDDFDSMLISSLEIFLIIILAISILDKKTVIAEFFESQLSRQYYCKSF